MTSHLHLIVQAENGKLSDILRDFKKFTTKSIIKAIEGNRQESRRNWMLWLFQKAGEQNSRNEHYQFWQQGNHPILLETPAFTLEKLNYLHQNPVKAGIVDKPEDYLLSSARDYYGGKGLIAIEEHLTTAFGLRDWASYKLAFMANP